MWFGVLPRTVRTVRAAKSAALRMAFTARTPNCSRARTWFAALPAAAVPISNGEGAVTLHPASPTSQPVTLAPFDETT